MAKIMSYLDRGKQESAQCLIGGADVCLGEIADAPFYVNRAQFAFREHTHLIIDAVPGGGANAFSLDGPTDWACIARSRRYTDTEWAFLSQQPLA